MRPVAVFALAVAGLLAKGSAAFQFPHSSLQKSCQLKLSQQVDVDIQTENELRSVTASKFKITTCTSTACAKRRQRDGMDELATFSAFFSRIQDSRIPQVKVEEGPCLGSCKLAPCVAIEHEDYEGTVALEGMTQSEFDSSW
jgi:NADH:ubiquinone oxidoreductase subunit E